MLTPSRRNHCELKKKLWSLIFALQLISLNLTQPPPQSFLVDLKTIHPMDCMEIWPKKHKNQNKTPKTIAPNHQKCHKKKWLHCGSCSPFQSGLFLWKAVALLAIWSVRQHPPIPWKKERGFLFSIFAKGFKKQPMNVRNIIQDIIFSLQLIIFVLNLLDTLSIMICLKPNMKGIGL